MTPQQAEDLARAVGAVYAAFGWSAEIRFSAIPPAGPFNVGTDIEALAEQAPPEARRAVLLGAVGRAWAARPDLTLCKLLTEAAEWTAAGGRFDRITDIHMLNALQAMMEAGT